MAHAAAVVDAATATSLAATGSSVANYRSSRANYYCWSSTSFLSPSLVSSGGVQPGEPLSFNLHTPAGAIPPGSGGGGGSGGIARGQPQQRRGWRRSRGRRRQQQQQQQKGLEEQSCCRTAGRLWSWLFQGRPVKQATCQPIQPLTRFTDVAQPACNSSSSQWPQPYLSPTLTMATAGSFGAMCATRACARRQRWRRRRRRPPFSHLSHKIQPLGGLPVILERRVSCSSYVLQQQQLVRHHRSALAARALPHRDCRCCCFYAHVADYTEGTSLPRPGRWSPRHPMAVSPPRDGSPRLADFRHCAGRSKIETLWQLPPTAATCGSSGGGALQLQEEGQPRVNFSFDIVEAGSDDRELLQAAAHLRSLSFYSYPSDRSRVAAEQHRQMKAMAELECLQKKVAGEDKAFPRVTCLVALCDRSDPPPPSLLHDDNHLNNNLDNDYNDDDNNDEHDDDDRPWIKTRVSYEGKRWWTVGTLDVNLGIRLAGEELIGDFPKGGIEDAKTRRAYLSNVCVAEWQRRKGVAAKLIEAAGHVAQEWGVHVLYVHVVRENQAARSLYHRCGFALEKEESAAVARLLDRPPRLLLRKILPPLRAYSH